MIAHSCRAYLRPKDFYFQIREISGGWKRPELTYANKSKTMLRRRQRAALARAAGAENARRGPPEAGKTRPKAARSLRRQQKQNVFLCLLLDFQ